MQKLFSALFTFFFTSFILKINRQVSIWHTIKRMNDVNSRTDSIKGNNLISFLEDWIQSSYLIKISLFNSQTKMQTRLTAISFILIMTFFLPVSNFAQKSFFKTFGGNDTDVLQSIESAGPNSFLIAGYSESYDTPNNRDFFVSIMDLDGNLSNSLTIGTSDRDILYKAFMLDGDYILAGMTTKDNTGNVNDDMIISRRNPSGGEVWSVTWGASDKDDELRDALITEENNIVACGGSLFMGLVVQTEVQKGVVLVYDKFGDLEWAKWYKGGGFGWTQYFSKFTRIKEVSDGFVIAGYTDFLNNGNAADVLLANKWTKMERVFGQRLIIKIPPVLRVLLGTNILKYLTTAILLLQIM